MGRGMIRAVRFGILFSLVLWGLIIGAVILWH